MLGDGIVTTKPGGNNNQDNTLEDEKFQSYPSSKRVTDLYGQHESYDFYMRARSRKRNMGLYTANRINPNGQNQKTAVYTRQRNNGGNNNNGRFGFEVAEERDYYPYWHWSPWRDLLVETTDTTRCPHYMRETQNIAPKGECVTSPPYLCENYEQCREQQYNNGNNNDREEYQYPNNPKDCESFPTLETNIKTSEWQQRSSFGISPLDYEGNNLRCTPAQGGRTNHLGNTDTGWAPQYNLVVPNAALRAPHNYNGLSDDRCISETKVNVQILSSDGASKITTFTDVKDCVSIDYLKQLLQNQRRTFRYQMKLCKDIMCNNSPRGLGRTGTDADKGARGTLKDHGITSDTPLYLTEKSFEDGLRCVLRVRYNISSGDFNGWKTFAADNQGGHIGATGDPSADFVGLGPLKSGPLELSVNTAQFSRVFEDRSHVFRIKPWPASVQYGVSAIHNFNVRGRRGNIVQVYPAVEYDFVSSGLEGSMVKEVAQYDHLHIQWCGSDANPQGNAGNGRQATDRHNLVQIESRSQNKPMDTTYTCADTVLGCAHGGNVNREWNWYTSMFPTSDVTARLAWVDQSTPDRNYTCDLNTDDENDITNCMYLNNAPAYFDAGLVVLNHHGEFHLMSTRNNAFTNRGQKTTMTVATNVVLAVGGLLIGAGLIGLIGLAAFCFFGLPRYAYHNRTSCWAKTCCGRAGIAKYQSQIELGKVSDPDKHEKSITWSKWDEWWAYEGRRVRWVLGLVGANVLMALYGFFKAKFEKPLLPIAYPLAKAGGSILNFNCATILIPVCRNMLSWLRTTPVSDLLPLDDNIYFHKLCGLGIVFGAVLHVGCHHWNFYELMYNYQYGTTAQSYVGMMFGSFANITGYAILAAMIPMYVTAMECIRRSQRGCCSCCCSCFRKWCCCCCKGTGYTLFFNVHKLWYLVIALLWLHGKSFWIYSLWPVIFCLMEKVIQSRRGKQPVTVLEVVQHASDVIEVKMRLNCDKRLKYTAGQYVFINVPVISENEWHPFTLSSAPEEPFFSCHIRCRKDMDWTFALRKLLNPDLKKNGTFKGYQIATQKEQIDYLRSLIKLDNQDSKDSKGTPKEGEHKTEMLENPMTNSGGRLQPVIRCDGPYGSASEEVFDFNTLMLVGAGIGVTPFASILRSLVARQKLPGNQMPKVYF
jgi:NADPH oxidase